MREDRPHADDHARSRAPSGLGVLLFVSVSFGLAFGVYEVFLPLYWDSIEMDRSTMGVIFSVAALGVFLLRIYVGRLSDSLGRKLFYTLSLGGSCIASFATPLAPGVLVQFVLKTTREASALVRDTMHSVLLYERSAQKFMGSLGITRGAEFTCHGLGSLVGGLLVAASASVGSEPQFTVPFVFSGGLILLATAAFAGFFRTGPPRPGGQTAQSLRSLFSPDLPPKLWLLVAFGFIFELGLFTSHCFIMPIFFKEMLTGALDVHGVEMIVGVCAIMAVHRIVGGLPMMVVAPRLRRNLKGLFIGFVFCEGGAIALAPLVPNPWIAVSVWLMHDLLGAGIWSPIHSNYIQKYSRPESRGADVSKVQGLSQLGRIVGPLLAGLLWAVPVGAYSAGAPFVVSGIIVSLSSLILLKL